MLIDAILVRKAAAGLKNKSIDRMDWASDDEVAKTVRIIAEWVDDKARQERYVDFTVDEGAMSKDLDVGGDLGVKGRSGFSQEQLSDLLGFKNSLPPLWNVSRALDGIKNLWDYTGSPADFDLATLAPGIAEFHLLWHQLVGVSSIVDLIFSEQQQEAMSGFLLADSMGLGKTAEILATMAFLMQVVEIENNPGQPRPPIIGEPSHSSLFLVIPCIW